jgi:hypothetical protein
MKRQGLMTVNSRSYVRVAWQSALSAALCLGFPAGMLLWLVLLQQMTYSSAVDQAVAFLQANGLNKIIVLALCSFGWSYLLGRISGYRPWWRIGLATMLGIFIAWFSPLSNMDGWFGDKLPIPALYAVAMCGIVFSATACVGLAYGILLRSLRAALAMAFTTGLVSVIALLMTILLFYQFGIYVGSEVPFAMSKVTVTSLMLSAIAGGAALGVGFSCFVEKQKLPPLV